MRRDKKFAIFLIIISFAIAGVLQFMRSTNKEYNLTYLATLESNLIVLDEKCSNELNTYSGMNTEVNNLPIECFVEEQGIIEEFTDQNQGESVAIGKESKAIISFVNDKSMSTNHNFRIGIPHLQTLEEAARETNIITTSKKNGLTHKIRANDNLYNLAIKYYKDQSKWTMIYQANKNQMSDPNSLKIGQELLIPKIKTSKEAKQKESPQNPTPLVYKQIL
jgi:hypothetical protein